MGSCVATPEVSASVAPVPYSPLHAETHHRHRLTRCCLHAGSQPALETKAAAPSAEESARLTKYLDAEYENELAMSPEDLTSRGRKDQYDKLDDYSDAGDDRLLEFRRKSVADMTASFP